VGRENLQYPAYTALLERDSGALWWVQVKHYTHLAVGCLAPSGDWLCFTGLSLKLQPKAVQMRSTDEVYGSLAYDGAPLLHVSFCVSRAFLVFLRENQFKCLLFVGMFIARIWPVFPQSDNHAGICVVTEIVVNEWILDMYIGHQRLPSSNAHCQYWQQV